MTRPRITAFAQALCLACGFADMQANAQSRFQLSGTATLVPDAPAQRVTDLRLKATLSHIAAPAVAPPAQRSGRFALVAYADTVATACYNDTIFRDGFDGDGL